MKKYTILFLVVSLFAVLYGCCSRSHDVVFIKPNSDTVITSREITIDELGRLPTVTFPSGAKIEGLEENTLTPGIVVTIVEKKMTAQNAGSFFNSSDSDIYLYKISAVLNPENSLEAKTPVTSFEKPFKITLPKPQNPQGIVLAGIKESDTDPWRLFNYSDSNEILTNIASARAVEDNTGDNTFNLFRLGTEFALISYEGNSGNRLPETFVSSLTASSTNSILVKEGKYIEDLTVKGILKGVKLDTIKPTELRARITYRNNKLEEAPIKVNDVKVTQISLADKTVPGYTYSHSFMVYFPSESNIIGTDGDFSFKLNLDGVETQSFSSGLLIEFFNKIDSEKILPYNYTEYYPLEQKEVIDVAIRVDSGKDESQGNLFELNPTFTLEIGKELSDNGKEKVEDAVSVTNVEPDKITKDWNEEGLTIGFAEELEPATTYTLSVDDVTDVDGLSITNVEDFTFTTKSANNAFTIVYNLDGGDVNTPNQTSYEASETFSLINPTKAGYEFIGWSGTGLTGNNNLNVTIEPGSTGNREYTANFALISYNIAYELDGGTETTNPTKYDVTSATITLNKPTKDGYVFTGWTGTDLDAASVTLKIPQGSIGERNYTANWGTNTYYLTINQTAGIDTVTGEGFHEYGSDVSVSYTLLAGFDFDSWSGDFTTENFVMPANNATMTANAKPIVYNITYESNGGSFATANPASYDITSATIEINNPTRLGYSFTGWTGTGLDAASMTLKIPQGSIEDRTYTANWATNSYMLTLNMGTGITSVTGAGLKEYNSIVTVGCTMQNGYEFASWSGDFTTDTFNMPAANATMTANAKPIAYNITYDPNGGRCTTATPASYDITSSTITLNNPTRDDYHFLGWEGTGIPDGTASMAVTIPQGSTGDRNYVASFSQGYTITYNLNGGSVATPNPVFYNEYYGNITLTNPTRAGSGCTSFYLFAGWTGTGITNATTSVVIPSGSSGDREYTANWVELELKHISAGTFTMGSPSDELGRGYWEMQHKVVLTKDFYIGTYEVTQDQYYAVMRTNPSENKDGLGANVRPTTTANYPVEKLSFNLITSDSGFIAKLNEMFGDQLPEGYSFNLPTEAQWEYACRAGTTTALNSGKNLLEENLPCANLDEVAWYRYNYGTGTHQVGQKAPNAWGLYDMHGNVYEVCRDFSDGFFYTTHGDSEDPTGPLTGTHHIWRGGCYTRYPNECRSAARKSDNGDNNSYGFRVVISDPVPTRTTYNISYNLNGGVLSSPNPTTYSKTSDDITLSIPTKTGNVIDGFYIFAGWTGGGFITPKTTMVIPQGSTGDREYTANWVKIELSQIFEGTFTMGSPEGEFGRYANEEQHQVTLTEDFYMSKYEVTQELYFTVMGTNPSSYRLGSSADEMPTTTARCPVENISFDSITSPTGFIAKVNELFADQLPVGYHFDLPTEAQWEYACRAGTNTALNSGESFSTANMNLLGWNLYNSTNTPHTVGQKLPNAWGLFDMHGNVLELCKDWFADDYYSTCGDCSDPVGPYTGTNKVCRGGSYNVSPQYCRSAFRTQSNPANASSYVGFRLVVVRIPTP